jgi:hypothetical protein
MEDKEVKDGKANGSKIPRVKIFANVFTSLSYFNSIFKNILCIIMS